MLDMIKQLIPSHSPPPIVQAPPAGGEQDTQSVFDKLFGAVEDGPIQEPHAVGADPGKDERPDVASGWDTIDNTDIQEYDDPSAALAAPEAQSETSSSISQNSQDSGADRAE